MKNEIIDRIIIHIELAESSELTMRIFNTDETRHVEVLQLEVIRDILERTIQATRVKESNGQFSNSITCVTTLSQFANMTASPSKEVH